MNDHGITVTIKYGKGYEVPWAVFKSASVETIRADIISYFGLDHQAVAELTLNELVSNVSQVAQGIGNAAATLGAVVIPRTSPGPTTTSEGNPWAGIGDDESKHQEWPAHPHQALIDSFALAAGVKDLQAIWFKNQDAFTDEAVQAAYKARGKELSQ